jgi:hypothetical protein
MVATYIMTPSENWDNYSIHKITVNVTCAAPDISCIVCIEIDKFGSIDNTFLIARSTKNILPNYLLFAKVLTEL